MGAANVATYRLLKSVGVDPAAIVACDSMGTLHPGRADIAARGTEFADKWRACGESNGDRIAGGIADALRGADVCIAFTRSGPGIVRPEWVRGMAARAVVLACANPVPEIWPWDAQEAGAAVMATGRGDFPNQVNNALAFPGIFRGVLDVRARTISDEMAIAAAAELAACVPDSALAPDRIVPTMDDPEIAVRVAVATATAAQAQGLARLAKTREIIAADAAAAIRSARAATRLMMDSGLIAAVPPG
jgi:malate dehydrogenase (oxaloacetate-decarboxylating)